MSRSTKATRAQDKANGVGNQPGMSESSQQEARDGHSEKGWETMLEAGNTANTWGTMNLSPFLYHFGVVNNVSIDSLIKS
jgi:hypothetical protein